MQVHTRAREVRRRWCRLEAESISGSKALIARVPVGVMGYNNDERHHHQQRQQQQLLLCPFFLPLLFFSFFFRVSWTCCRRTTRSTRRSRTRPRRCTVCNSTQRYVIMSNSFVLHCVLCRGRAANRSRVFGLPRRECGHVHAGR